MFRVYAILAVVALVGGGGWAIIGKLTSQAATIASRNAEVMALRGENIGLRVSITEKTANNDALRRDKNKAIRSQRADTTSFKEGLNDETHDDDSYTNSLNRAIAGSLNSLQGASSRD